MDDLVKLEKRLLDLVTETEWKAGSVDPRGSPWAWVPRSWGWTWDQTRTTVAMAWMPVRAKALELVRQRDALTARVLFTQMSMISSRIRELENRANWREIKGEESLKRLEEIIYDQQAEIRSLEDLVRRIMHRNRVSVDQSRGDQSPVSVVYPKPERASLFPLNGDDDVSRKTGHRRRFSIPFIRRPRSR
jgi:hypothetical protein